MAQISMLLHDEHLPFCSSKIDEIHCEFEPQRPKAVINGALDEFAIAFPFWNAPASKTIALPYARPLML